MIERSKKEIFELSLIEYLEAKKDYEQKIEAYEKAYAAYEIKFRKIGDTSDLQKNIDNAISELDEARDMYNLLAHQVLQYYEQF